jgi:hypothetical protein
VTATAHSLAPCTACTILVLSSNQQACNTLRYDAIPCEASAFAGGSSSPRRVLCKVPEDRLSGSVQVPSLSRWAVASGSLMSRLLDKIDPRALSTALSDILCSMGMYNA